MDAHNKKYKILSEKYGIPAKEVKAICCSQFKLVKMAMLLGKDEPIYLQNLARFFVPQGKRYSIDQKHQKIRERVSKQKAKKK